VSEVVHDDRMLGLAEMPEAGRDLRPARRAPRPHHAADQRRHRGARRGSRAPPLFQRWSVSYSVGPPDGHGVVRNRPSGCVMPQHPSVHPVDAVDSARPKVPRHRDPARDWLARRAPSPQGNTPPGRISGGTRRFDAGRRAPRYVSSGRTERAVSAISGDPPRSTQISCVRNISAQRSSGLSGKRYHKKLQGERTPSWSQMARVVPSLISL
jgi:hypothetical protein